MCHKNSDDSCGISLRVSCPHMPQQILTKFFVLKLEETFSGFWIGVLNIRWYNDGSWKILKVCWIWKGLMFVCLHIWYLDKTLRFWSFYGFLFVLACMYIHKSISSVWYSSHSVAFQFENWPVSYLYWCNLSFHSLITWSN